MIPHQFRLIVFLLVMACLTPFGVAIEVIYYNPRAASIPAGDDNMQVALTNLSALGGFNVTQVNDDSVFADEVFNGGAYGKYDIAVLLLEDLPSGVFPNTAAAAAALGASNHGMGVIYSDTSFALNNTFAFSNQAARAFGAEWDGTSNHTELLITDPDLAVGLPSPVQLTSPGTGVFSMGLDDNGNLAANFSPAGAIAFGATNRVIVNGFLTDSFVDSAEGVQLYTNELRYITSRLSSSVPEGGAGFLMLGGSFLGLILARRGRRGA